MKCVKLRVCEGFEGCEGCERCEVERVRRVRRVWKGEGVRGCGRVSS